MNDGVRRSSGAMAPWLVVGAAACATLVLWLLWTQRIVFGSDAGQWVYRYLRPPTMRPLLVALVAVPPTLLVLRWSLRRVASDAPGVLLGWIGWATVLDVLLRAPLKWSLGQLVQSTGANAFLLVARKLRPMELLSAAPDVLERLPMHARSNMPGKTLFFHALGLLTDSTEVMGLLILVLSNLGAVLVYVVARRLAFERETALTAAVLYLVLPARLAFLPILNVLSPLFILGSFALFLAYLESGRPLQLAAFGLVLYATVFWEPLPLAMGLVFVAMLAAWWRTGRTSGRRVGAVVLVTPVIFGLATLLVAWTTGFDVVRHFAWMLEDAIGFNERAGRAFETWVVPNLREFLIGAGPLSSLALVVFLVALAVLPGLRRTLAPEDRAALPLQFATVLTLVALLVLGVNRGEVTRLWLFLAAFWCLAAAPLLAPRRGVGLLVVAVVAHVLQVAISAETVTFVRP